MILKVQIRGRLSALIPFVSSMKVTELTASEDEPESGEIEGEFQLDGAPKFTMVDFITNIAQDKPIIGRYWAFFENEEENEYGKFVWDGTRAMELETDRWGNFTFPDAGCAADFDEFLTRERASMLEFLLFRDHVGTLIYPREMLYTDVIIAARKHLGEDFSQNGRFVEVLRHRVREIQAQEADNMLAYEAFDFLLTKLGKDGLAIIESDAENAAADEE